MRRVCISVLLLAAIVLSAPPVGAEEGSDPTLPVAVISPALPGDGDACTGVPDTLPGIFDFTAACESHDACYAAGVDRLACDLAFREDLVAACQSQHPDLFDPRRYACLFFANLYFF